MSYGLEANEIQFRPIQKHFKILELSPITQNLIYPSNKIILHFDMSH
jgi:hypothetical protein